MRWVIFKRLVVLGLVLRVVQLVIWIYVELKGITSISDRHSTHAIRTSCIWGTTDSAVYMLYKPLLSLEI